jgi:Flp pilus assembly protein TadB
MADLKSLAEGATQKAALAAGKEMARRAIDDLTLSPEEKQKRDEEAAAARKKSLLKYGVIGVIGVVAVLSVMSLLAKLWMYAIGFLVVAGIGGAGYLALKPKIEALKQRALAGREARRKAEEERKQLEAAQAAALAAERAKLEKEKKLEDELLALKKKV